MGFLLGFSSGAETRAQLSSQAEAEWELAQAQAHKGMESIQAQLQSVQAQLQQLTQQQDELEEEIEELVEETT